MVVNKTYFARYWKPKQKIKTILLQNASSVHFWCSVHGHRKDSLEHHLLQPGCIHQNFAKQYNDRSNQIVNIILLSIGK